MSRPLVIRYSRSLVSALDRACFPEPIPGNELLTYRKLPDASLEEGLFSLVDSGPFEFAVPIDWLIEPNDIPATGR